MVDGGGRDEAGWAAPVALDYLAPAPDLRPLVSSYYFFRAEIGHLEDVTRADLAQLRFMLAGAGIYRFGRGLVATTPEIALTGPTSAATRIELRGLSWVFGIGLLPAGWAALVGSRASDSSDRVEDATLVFGPRVREALDRLRWAPSIAAMGYIADGLIRALARRPREAALRFTDLVDGWLVGDASPNIDRLIADSGLSARQVERLSNQLYGAPPKLLARKYRALRAASAIAAGEDWRMLLDGAFYDQSHAIREFRRFVGMTPAELLRAPSPVTRLTLDRRRLTDTLPPLTLLT